VVTASDNVCTVPFSQLTFTHLLHVMTDHSLLNNLIQLDISLTVYHELTIY